MKNDSKTYQQILANNLNRYYELPQEQRSELIDVALNHLTDAYDKKDEMLQTIKEQRNRELTDEDIQVSIITGMVAVINHLIQYQLKEVDK